MRRILTAASLAILLAACGSQPPAPEQNAAGEESRKPKDVGGTEITRVTANDDLKGFEELNDPKSPLYKKSIYFDYDQFVIKDEFRPTVEAHAKFITRNAKVKVLIQGNADERGSREYNLALGQKRSEAVKKSLSLLGAKEDQMEAVSLGEEKPRCTDHSEECWAQNRRADLVYSERK